MRITITENIVRGGDASTGMLEVLLSRGDGVKLVQVHGFRIVKVIPVAGNADVCAGFTRGKTADNTEKLSEIYQAPFGEYMVTVCSGVITAVNRVLKEEQVRESDVVTAVDDDEVMSAETIEPRRRGKRTV